MSHSALIRGVLNHTHLVLSSRCISTSSVRFSGHNRWSKIKHDKGKVDASKTKQRSFLAKELAQVSKENGADPSINTRLAGLIAAAKRAGFPKASIESAIARGQGISPSGAPLETVIIEAMLPPSIATLIECQTDSKARTLQTVREALKHLGATVTPTAYMFSRMGRLTLQTTALPAASEEHVLEAAIEAGALDVQVLAQDGGEGEDMVLVYTEPSELSSVAEALSRALGVAVDRQEVIWQPREDSRIEVDSAEMAEQIDKFVAKLEDDPSVQAVYLNTV